MPAWAQAVVGVLAFVILLFTWAGWWEWHDGKRPRCAWEPVEGRPEVYGSCSRHAGHRGMCRTRYPVRSRTGRTIMFKESAWYGRNWE